jgi:hypothetical protein
LKQFKDIVVECNSALGNSQKEGKIISNIHEEVKGTLISLKHNILLTQVSFTHFYSTKITFHIDNLNEIDEEMQNKQEVMRLGQNYIKT